MNDPVLLSPEVQRALQSKYEAEARKARAEAERTELALAQELREEQERLTRNHYHRVLPFEAPIADSTVKQAMAQIDLWRREDPSLPITVRFNSPGGSVIDGLALWDYLMEVRRGGTYLTTVAYGMAASMAGILLQAGDHRVMGRESWLMIHEAAFGILGKTSEVEDRLGWVKRVQERILDIFASRSTRSKTSIRRNWTRKDWFLSAEEALTWGFIDEIQPEATVGQKP